MLLFCFCEAELSDLSCYKVSVEEQRNVGMKEQFISCNFGYCRPLIRKKKKRKRWNNNPEKEKVSADRLIHKAAVRKGQNLGNDQFLWGLSGTEHQPNLIASCLKSGLEFLKLA